MQRIITMHTSPRQTDGHTDRRRDRRTDEHRGNSAMIRSTNASRAKNLNCARV